MKIPPSKNIICWTNVMLLTVRTFKNNEPIYCCFQAINHESIIQHALLSNGRMRWNLLAGILLHLIASTGYLNFSFFAC